MRITCGIEYDGSRYHGWQRQKNAKSVQQEVEEAISKVANHPIITFCAGRTDAAVHATGQVIHFDTTADRQMYQWVMGCNTHLPKDISVSWARRVPDTFHARFKATERAYRYIVRNHSVRSALTYRYVSSWFKPVEHELMQQAAIALIGIHDFSSFRAVSCQANTPVRDLRELRVQRQGDILYIDVRANGFLQHMVRNLAGLLLTIGGGDRPVQWAAEVLQVRDRTKAGITAPPNGLYLTDVVYPEEYQLPKSGYQPVYGGPSPLSKCASI